MFCGSLVGASLGFLWYNSYPAEIFMGDVGSLALGAALGTVAILIKQELLLVIVGGVFVLEALSVVIQVASFKMTGKRVFKMAPLHHHFELIGWSEPKVITRFVIVSIIFALFSLTTLKLRMTIRIVKGQTRDRRRSGEKRTGGRRAAGAPRRRRHAVGSARRRGRRRTASRALACGSSSADTCPTRSPAPISSC